MKQLKATSHKVVVGDSRNMTEVDRVLKPIKVSFEGNVDLSELYHLIKSFMSDKKYDINEKSKRLTDFIKNLL